MKNNSQRLSKFSLLSLTAAVALGLTGSGCKDNKAELDKLRQENQELQAASAKSQETLRLREGELEQLRKSTEELARLRSEVQQLPKLRKDSQGASNQLTQLRGELAQLRGQQQQLNQTVAQVQQQAQQQNNAVACAGSLRQIDAVLNLWAQQNQKPVGTIPADADLFGAGRYLQTKPVCPAGGAYGFRVGVKATCTAGHSY